jgi:WhiB family transcriptional regulator, redox-sensing transcriptional regulator
MPEDTSIGSTAARPLPVVMLVAAAPALGDWHGRGLCVGEDLDVFFPSHGDPGSEARRICGLCQVRGDCLEYATEADEHGIWGGLDQEERRNRRKRQRRRTAATAARATGKHGRAEGAA